MEKSFKVTGVSNKLDGSEDDPIFDGDVEMSSDEDGADSDRYH